MITPQIHRSLTESAMACLLAEMHRVDPPAAQEAWRTLRAGNVDAVLDSPVALDAVLGLGGPPAPLPLTLLWYVPVRAALLELGEDDVELADYAATIPIALLSTRTHRRLTRGRIGIAQWWTWIAALPDGSVAQGERAADTAAVALWWAGCFPEWVRGRGGNGLLRAYATFAEHAFQFAARLLAGRTHTASLLGRVSAQSEAVCAALNQARSAYLGPEAHTSKGRLDRFLERLQPDGSGPTLN